jgi:hypothetical protein
LALAEPRAMHPLVAHCHLCLGKMHHRMGNPGPAQEHLAIAMAMYREMGMIYWLVSSRLKRTNSDRQSAMAVASLGVRFQASKKVLAPSLRLQDLALP